MTFIVRDGPLSLGGNANTAMPAFLFAWILGTALAVPHMTRGAALRDQPETP
jgi:hypothetical protein